LRVVQHLVILEAQYAKSSFCEKSSFDFVFLLLKNLGVLPPIEFHD